MFIYFVLFYIVAAHNLMIVKNIYLKMVFVFNVNKLHALSHFCYSIIIFFSSLYSFIYIFRTLCWTYIYVCIYLGLKQKDGGVSIIGLTAPVTSTENWGPTCICSPTCTPNSLVSLMLFCFAARGFVAPNVARTNDCFSRNYKEGEQ